MPQRSKARREPDGLADLDVRERRLDNGMVLLVAPRPQSPIVVCDLYYDAGSARDPAGKTGLAHFLEHMLFKGTRRFPKGAIDQLAFRSAGAVNAETGEDFAHYWFELPAGSVDLALAIESDRMGAAEFDPEEVERERRVILEERAGELDSPLARLDRAHRAMSYLNHPYRNPILGWPDDFRDLGADDLGRFYREHYCPGRATLVIVGDVDPGAMIDRASHYFGGLEGAAGPAPLPLEPAQLGRRDFRLEDGDFVTRGLFGWHTILPGHEDAAALSVAADLLGGGKRSRLWERLVERERIATDVDVFHEPARWGGQFLVSVDLAPRADPKRAEAAVFNELARLAEEGPTPAERERARNRLEAGWRWSRLDPATIAGGLGQSALAGDWKSWHREAEQARGVTSGDIRRVAGRHLVESNLTLGWSVPGSRRVVLAPQRPSPLLEAERSVVPPISPDWGMPTTRAGLKGYRPERSTLPCGLRLVVDPVEGAGVVALDLYCDAGQLREASPGLAYLSGRMLEEGAGDRDASALAEAVERLGGTIEAHATGVSLRMRSEDFPLALEIAGDVARRPTFPEASLDWIRRRIGAEIRADREDPGFRAEEAFRRMVYGSEHPYGRDPRGTPRGLAHLGIEDLRDHHRRWFRPNNAILVVSGEFDRGGLIPLLERHLLHGWEPGPIPPLELPAIRRAMRPRLKRIEQEGDQVQVAMGHLGISRDHPDFNVLAVLDLILGGAGLTDRLNRRIREELGLAYSIAGTMTDSADRVPGVFRIAFGTSPDRLEQALGAVREEVAAVRAGDFGDEEVEAARAYLLSSWVFDFVAVDQRCERLLDLERLGLAPDDPIRRAEELGAIPADRVRLAAREHLDPARFLCAICGPPA